jgi:FdhD protein
VKIVKYNLFTKSMQEINDTIAEEKPLHLFLNTTYWATILCSPMNLEDMAVGHLLSEGVIKSIKEIEEIKSEENTCTVKLTPNINVENRVKLSRLHTRIIPSACGGSSPYQYKGKTPKVKSNLQVKATIVFDCVNQLNTKAEIFRRTGGVHVASIYSSDGSMVAIAEDVGRHNAVDKSIGSAALKNVDFGECFLALSGRISGDVAFKAAKVGLPIVASLAAALSSGIEMAESTNLTLAGFVRGKRMNIYTHQERITL